MNTTAATRTVDIERDDFDLLTSFESKATLGRSLREGMLLVDPDLGTPVYSLDHRMTDRAPGTWFVLDHETGRYATVVLSARLTFPVAVTA